MKLSACITINDRPYGVLDKVFDSMAPQEHDEFVIVLDRTPAVLADFIIEYWKGDKRTIFVEVGGDPGWRSPVKAWNAGYEKVSGEAIFCFSSETTQNPGNLARARAELDCNQRVIFGQAECSCGPAGQEVYWGGAAPGNLLCSASHPRPLGFLWASPMAPIRKMGGWDPAFDAGLWYDESDHFLRLWRQGLDFVFDDAISGLHLHHERPVLATAEGQEGIRKNAEYMLWKHGTLDPWGQVPRLVETRPGRTTWRHL